MAAADLAREARMPLLELISGRDLKRSIPALAEKADSIIDAACARMEIGREHFESVLSRSWDFLIFMGTRNLWVLVI